MQNPRMTESMEPATTVDAFLKNVLRSGVLDRVELQDALRNVPLENRQATEAVADHLVDSGKLSRFQVSKLLKGMTVGLVLGPFHVLAPIGKGGMGTVYLARDSRSRLLVALKVLPPKRAREEERLLSRFRREMEMCQRVAHPHLAWAYEVGVCQGVYYIAMEYIPGQSLYRLVNDQGPLQIARAARLFSEVASALEHAHNQGLIHRDMKPSNIIITPHDHAKVLDLGLALVQGEAPGRLEVVGGRGYVVGTLDYIAPEQAENSTQVDPRCDIYSLGCTLYFALTGKPPFPSTGTPLEKIQRHRLEEPTPVPQRNPDVPPAFIGVLRKMMAKSPDQRFSSAAEVREKLLAWASEPSALPIDKQGDKEYQEAVAALETAEPPEELIEEVIPVGIPVPEKSPRRSGTFRRFAPPLDSPTEPPRPLWAFLLLGLGAGLLILVFALGLLNHFFGH
ncbi:MAG TPA: serine/threonine-protein kinase [Gemmataceae bacterium]|nr:serine/threonine-protein kinase [Gemmataceae bacterium]